MLYLFRSDRDHDELTIEMFDAQGYSIAEKMEARGVIALKEIEVETDHDIKFKMVQAWWHTWNKC